MASPLNLDPGFLTSNRPFRSATSALKRILGSELDENALKRMGSDTTEYVHTVASNVAAIADAHIKIIDAQTKQYSSLNSDDDQIESYTEAATEVREKFTEMKGLAETKAKQTKPPMEVGLKTAFVAGFISRPYLTIGVSSIIKAAIPVLIGYAWGFIAHQGSNNLCPPGFQTTWLNATDYSAGYSCFR